MSTLLRIFGLLVLAALLLSGSDRTWVWASAPETPGKAAGSGEPGSMKEGSGALGISLGQASPPGVVRLLFNLEGATASGPLTGQLMVWPAPGGLSATFLELPPAQRWVMDLTPPCSGPFAVGLTLTGVSPESRPLLLKTQVIDVSWLAQVPESRLERAWSRFTGLLAPLKISQPVAMVTTGPSLQWALLMGGAALILGFAGVVVYLRRQRGRKAQELESDLDILLDSMPRGSARLMLKARVETLMKEKEALQHTLKEMQEERERLTQEKTDLTAELARQTQAIHEQSQALEEAQLQVKVTQEEAKAMQEEYMALYARSGEDKETLGKN